MVYFREFSDVAPRVKPDGCFLTLGLIFLIASIGDWYTGNPMAAQLKPEPANHG